MRQLFKEIWYNTFGSPDCIRYFMSIFRLHAMLRKRPRLSLSSKNNAWKSFSIIGTFLETLFIIFIVGLWGGHSGIVGCCSNVIYVSMCTLETVEDFLCKLDMKQSQNSDFQSHFSALKISGIFLKRGDPLILMKSLKTLIF